MKLPHKITVNSKISKTGIDLFVNKDVFQIKYPSFIWKEFPNDLKNIFNDTIAVSSTLFLTQILNVPKIQYQTSRPYSEMYLFKMGIYDMPICAQVDGISSINYVRRFYNTIPHYKNDIIKTPKRISFLKKNSQPKAVIPFSFGKESLLSVLLCKELGIEPIPVYVLEPAYTYEYKHKKKLITQFEKKTGIKVHVIDYDPGRLRFGNYWGLKSELGLGLQCTEYSFMMLPFLHYYNADYIILGNEFSCNKTFIDSDGILTYKAGYDQHKDVTSHQSMMISLGLGRKIEIMSFVEPLYEIAETFLLHNRYKDLGQYQMSCFTANSDGEENRWCHNCEKCSYMYPLFTAFNIDLRKVDFKENLFEKKYAYLYESFFVRTPTSALYGSQDEMGLGIYLSLHNGHKGYVIDRFKKEFYSEFHKKRHKLYDEYLSIHNTNNINKKYKKKIFAIFSKELTQLKKILP